MLLKRLFCGTLAVSALLMAGQAMADYADVVLADNPVLYYQLEQTGSAVNSGSAGSAYDGIYNGNLVLGIGAVGSGVTFDGVDDYIMVPDTSSILGGTAITALTIEAWVYTSSVDSDGLGRIVQGATPFADIIYDGGGAAGNWRPSTYMYMNNGTYAAGDYTSTNATVDISLGEWHHLVLTGEEYNGDLWTKVFVDGAHIQTANQGPMSFISNGAELYLGGDVANTFMHNGGLDEIAFYNTALTPEQILEHYEVGILVPEPGTVVLLVTALMFMLFRKRHC